MATKVNYAARLEVDYPRSLDRVSSFFRLLWAIPILIVFCLLSGLGGDGFFLATLVMILFRLVYPRWWFDFILELNRFTTRIGAYVLLLTDRYPSTVDTQTVHLDIDYPNVQRDLNRWLPLVKWFLAIPHYIILAFLTVAAVVTTLIAWFAILFTGKYPRGLFDFVVGVARWHLRVSAYAFLLVTDKYPPFSLK